MIRTIIKGTGRYVPERIVTNYDLEEAMDTTHEWIEQRTGIIHRHWIEDNSNIGPSDLGYEASKIALKRSNWDLEDIDLVIFATQTPDHYVPSSGFVFHDKMGFGTTPVLSINQHCTGFLYGLVMADSFIKSDSYRRILLVCAEVQSTGIDISTRGRDNSILFADGAGAVCLERVDSKENIGVIGSILKAEGKYYKNIFMELPSSKLSPSITADMVKEGRHFLRMNGRKVFINAVRRTVEITHEILKKCNMGIDDIDLVIPHQANIRINESLRIKLGMSQDRFFNNIDRYGNTTAATIPIALDEVLELNREIKTILFIGYGAGESWGAILYNL